MRNHPFLRFFMEDYYENKDKEEFPFKGLPLILLRYDLHKIYDDVVQNYIDLGEIHIWEPKWKSQNRLFSLLKSVFKNYVIHEDYSPEFLKLQRYDVWFPDLNIAVEYNGLQHYEPVDFFGGEEGLEKQLEYDEKKQKLSDQNGVNLFIVNEGYDLELLVNDIKSIINKA
mgnify:CR=1 FL=1